MRIITLAIAFLIGTAAEAQIIRAEPFYTAPEEAAAPSGDLLLDSFPGAAVAYSLRKLDKDYTGSAIRVRRSSDNAEQDIGFVSNYLDTAAMKTFVGANNGFVVTWYNQADSAGVFGVRNATQATAGSQPQIITSGAITYVGGEVAFVFDGTADYLTCQPHVADLFEPQNQEASIYSVAQNIDSTLSMRLLSIAGNVSATASANDYIAIFGSLSSGSSILHLDIRDVSPSAQKTALSSPYTIGLSERIFSAVRTTGNGTASVNGNAGTSVDLTLPALSLFHFAMGALIRGTGPTINYSNFRMKELVLYNSDKTTDNTAIQSNINSFYSIY